MPRTPGKLQYGFCLPFARCWFRHQRNSVGSWQPLHRELDPAVAKVAPTLDLGHVSCLGISLQNGPRAFTRFLQRQGKGFAPKPVGRLAASRYSICKVLWRPRHEISEQHSGLPNLCGRHRRCQRVPGPRDAPQPVPAQAIAVLTGSTVQQIFCMFCCRRSASVFPSHFREN